MERSEFVKQVEAYGEVSRRSGWVVDIDPRRPCISIDHKWEPDIFIVGEEAAKALDAVPDDLTPEDWVLWTYRDRM